MDYPRNWHELLEWFPDEGACLRYLERLRWDAGFTCRFYRLLEGAVTTDPHPYGALTSKSAA